MPLQKLQFRPGVNREGTTLSNEGGWFDCDKIRFRSGYPEKIGGWRLVTPAIYLGTARSLWNWVTLAGYNLLGIGTSVKFYIELGGEYNDVTPIRQFATLTNPFTATNGSTTVIVANANHGAITEDSVTFSGATGFAGIPASEFNREHQITYIDSNTYSIVVETAATTAVTFTASITATTMTVTAVDVGTIAIGQTISGSGVIAGTTITGGSGSSWTISPTQNVLSTTIRVANGGTVQAAYQLNVASDVGSTQTGWGAGLWGGVVTNVETTKINVVGGINNSTATVTVQATTGFPTVGVILVESELITYTGITSTTFTGCVRGTNGTTAAAHANNTNVQDASNYTGWGQSSSITSNTSLRLWSQSNFGEDLLFNPRGGTLYHWGPGTGLFPDFSSANPSRAVGVFDGLITTTDTSTTITVTDVYEGAIHIGMEVAGAGIQAGTTIFNFGTGTGATGTYVLSLPATATASGVAFAGTSDAPVVINQILVSDSSRIVIAFGCNDYGEASMDPMLIRWTAQESYTNWTPSADNQAGSYRLSHGSQIVSALQTRQEIIVWTDSAIYAMQYLGPPYVWGFTLLADNVSIASPNAAATAAGVTYWMGTDKFYAYSGRVETLPCALRSYVFDDMNRGQQQQFFAGTNEGYSEIWWFYCSITGPDGTGTVDNPNIIIDKYVIFNYLDRVWYYGSMSRTAWLDSPLRQFPQAATYTNQIVFHEAAVDDGLTNPPSAIPAHIETSDFDIGDGHNYGFVWRMLPDITFNGSNTSNTTDQPQVKFTLRPKQNPGSAYGTTSSPTVASAQNYSNVRTYNVQEFTEIIYTRVRGRQMAFRIESDSVGTQWQLGTPRMDVKPDGRR
jgi:hypothetical protein